MRFVCLGLLLFVFGCSEPPRAERLKIADVPDELMTIAKEKLPGVTFDQAIVKSDGVYEIIGKDEKGKVREIELSPDGNVVEIE